ncbi:(2Fe-2S)-binding protein [Amycolatopsis eburnea]|uniref:(2Fe-2S)-binding protein n=1 Tax=Amycolatopsis eburnea TaxID=2267691 RepID=A0A3R9DSY2_9PSEU|nr:(2Fe-2S)-binding protein [Amycolatopsis eburnea]RSD11723.1 (2Fe-2S)-binding protein [Amycolatopsis eburnea]
MPEEAALHQEPPVAGYPVSVTVNGKPRSLLVDGAARLLGVLRDELGLTGAKAGCAVGVCGACTVLVDGAPTSSCLTFAAQVDGAEVVTVEGLAAHPGLRALQEDFLAEGGFQCGYCTSGQLVTAASLVLSGELFGLSDADIRERMLGNLCRCGAYYGIVRAIEKAREAG